jgi:hypothetical protein
LLQGDSLIVAYSVVMQMDDFEDGVYVRSDSSMGSAAKTSQGPLIKVQGWPQ